MASDPVCPDDRGREQIDAAADQFETDWKAGQRPRLEEILAQHEPADRAELLRELLLTEWELRQRDGEPIVVAEYHARFPENRTLIEQLASAEPTVSFVESAATDKPPELSVVGQYTLLRKLGQGGMGTVYEAEHLKLHKRVALKLLSKGLTRDANAVARFEREMKAVGQLDHPHIVRATDAGEADGQHFLVMDLIDGIDLNDLLKVAESNVDRSLRDRNSSHGVTRLLSIPDACELIRQAALGLQRAHEQGLVHRDIKPSNLMLCLVPGAAGLEPIVKVLDFGLALLVDCSSQEVTRITTSRQVMGTLDYMAPEQGGDSHHVDSRADIYSLGATLYKLLTGHSPFGRHSHSSPMEKLMAIASEPVPPIILARSEIPAELAALVHQMLEKRRELRPAASWEIAQRVSKFTEGADLRLLVEQVRSDHADQTAPSESGTFTRSIHA